MNRRRRTFVIAGSAAGLGFASRPGVLRAEAPPKKLVALLAGRPEIDDPATAPFFAELRRLGWIDGKTIRYERLYARGARDKVAELARAAVAQRPDLIYAPTAFAASAAINATSMIPVVFATVTDPVVIGLVNSLGRPGKNATGTFQIQADLATKKFEIVREALPQVKRIGVLLDFGGRSGDYAHQRERHDEAAKSHGLGVLIADFSRFDEVADALARLKSEGSEVVTVGSSFTLLVRRRELVELTHALRLPLVAHRVEYAEAGAFITYGADVHDTLRRTARIAHRILNGARPADTPVEQASKFELVINVAAAKYLGIAVPKLLLARADRVIE